MSNLRVFLLAIATILACAGCSKPSPEKLVHQILTNRMVTLATAESCTGGAIASRFTAMPGASAYFLCGLVTYSNDSKRCLLGVHLDSIGRYGVVSQSVVRQMAEGARRRVGADYAIATTGIAGPTGGTPEAPLGTVWIAVASPEHTVSKCFHIDKDRRGVIEEASDKAIEMLLDELKNE